MKRIIYFACLVFFIGIGCSIKNPIRNENTAPVLSKLSIADTLYLSAGSECPVSVYTEDPQGWEDIQRVVCSVSSNRRISELILQDDGQNGDLIPRDGVFSGKLTLSSFGSLPGTYRIDAAAEDAEGNRSDSVYANVVVALGEKNRRPLLENPVVPDSVRTDSLGNLFFSVRASDPEGLNDIQSVGFDLYPPFAVTSSYHIALSDDGAGGDMIQNDGIFSMRGDFSDILKTPGLNLIRFEAQDRRGLISLSIVKKIFLIGVNDPPVLHQVAAPVEVSRQSALPILLTVQAGDPQGLGDIRRVYFNTTKPDGTPSSGNPFLMFDNGTNGDKTAGDGTYSLNIFITPQNALGVYRFEFFAEDLSGEVSSSLACEITVVDAIVD